MNIIRPSTKNEDKLFKSIQKVNGSLEDGLLGEQSMVDIAISLNADCFPLTMRLFNQPTIIGNDLLASDPNGPISNYQNSMIGSFSFPRAEKPCSILVNQGKVIYDAACHAWVGFPEAVIYRLWDGTFGRGEFKFVSELPTDVKWAIGGFGLMDLWNPDGQGFKIINGTDYYNSVVYKTSHGVLGIKNNKVFGILCKNMTGKEVNEFCKNKMFFDFAIMLDGGGLGAINGDESFAKINQYAKCAYMIQLI